MEGTVGTAADSNPAESAMEDGDSAGLNGLAADILVSVLLASDPAVVVKSSPVKSPR